MTEHELVAAAARFEDVVNSYRDGATGGPLKALLVKRQDAIDGLVCAIRTAFHEENALQHGARA